jgi:hypothetical protein
MKRAAISGDCNIIGIMFFFAMRTAKENVKIGAQNQVHSLVFSKRFEWAWFFILIFDNFLNNSILFIKILPEPLDFLRRLCYTKLVKLGLVYLPPDFYNIIPIMLLFKRRSNNGNR